MDVNKKWMASGKVGCTFAAMFAKDPRSICWETISVMDTTSMSEGPIEFPKNASLLSIQFPNSNKGQVIMWALRNGFREEDNGDGCIGLRYDVGDNVAWVQYFGPDAHVPTRRTPMSELMMCIKLPAKYYVKVGFKGILHLAHASVSSLTDFMADKLWNSSFINTKKRIGHKPTLREAAKTTYLK